MYHTLEAQKVLDDDSSKILLFFTSSTFNLSRQKPTLYQTSKVDELQPLQKGVVISWLGPLTIKKSYLFDMIKQITLSLLGNRIRIFLFDNIIRLGCLFACIKLHFDFVFVLLNNLAVAWHIVHTAY